MALDLTTAIAPDLAGRVLASILVSLVSIALCAGGTVALLAWSRRPPIHGAATRAVIGPCPETRGQVARRKPSFDDQRGACQRARIIAPHPCMRLVHKDLTMMQSCASAAKLRGGGPILRNGATPWSASGDRHLGSSAETDDVLFVRAPRTCPVRILPSRCSQNDASRHLARGHHSPQCDQQLSREGHDQGLARVTTGVGRPRPVPLRQRTLLLMKQEAPGQLDHPAPHAGVARLGGPFLAPPAATLVG